jgi:16S rRNA (guanine1516-N2)-methyltransferase
MSVCMNMIQLVTYSSATQHAQAEVLARQLGLRCQPIQATNTGLVLNLAPTHLEIRDFEQNAAIHIDFITGTLAHRRQFGGGKNQPLARAIGIKPGSIPRVLDATAGLAKDAFVLATLGVPVIMLERSPFVAALIADAIHRAADDEAFSPLLQNGFELINVNAIDYLSGLTPENKPEVIYLDPMYPEKQKTALVKKNMRILQKLLGGDTDSEYLLSVARHKAFRRVVVKRPKTAGPIADMKPAFAIASKNTRYDVYLPY